MIVSVSRRTDIPACYADWFFNRLDAGFADVRNPMNPRQVSRVGLTPEQVDAFVFWTKDPRPMLDRLDRLQGRAFYFLFTLTAYGRDLEPGLLDKETVLVPAFRKLAERIGPERVIWRYDPILLSERYPAAFHRQRFGELAGQLQGATSQCIISFLDLYAGTARRLQPAGLHAFSDEQRLVLAGDLSEMARRNGMSMSACAESLDLQPFGISPAACIDLRLLERLLVRPLRRHAGKPLRPGCNCLPSVDIGMYDTCRLGCLYCYARHSAAAAARLIPAHDPCSSLLCGQLGPDDCVRERKMPLLGR